MTGGGRRAPWNPAALGGILVAVILVAGVAIALLNMQASAGTPRAAAQDADVHAPTNLAAFTADREVVVSWQPARPVPDGYRVYRATGRRGPYVLLGTVNAPDINTFTDDDHFTLGVTYSYTVTAFNAASESAPAGPAAVVVTAASLHLPSSPSPTIPPPRPVPTFDTGNTIPVVGEGTAGPVPTPLPTFRALTHAEFTAIAREPKRRVTPRATPYRGISALTPTATPFATPVTTVGPAATSVPSAIGVSTPIATPTVLPPVVTETPTSTPTP